MSDKSDTPRTDAALAAWVEHHDGGVGLMTDHARQLERELSKAMAEIAAMKMGRANYSAHIANVVAKWGAEKINMKRELADAKAECERLREDAERINWLEANPRHAQIIINGETKDCVFYGISTHDLMPLRQAIDKARGKP